MTTFAMKVFGKNPNATTSFFLNSIFSYAFGQVGLKPDDYASPDKFDSHVLALYGVTVDRSLEPDLMIVKVRQDIAALSKTKRRKSRRAFICSRLADAGGLVVTGVEYPEDAEKPRWKAPKADRKEKRKAKLEARAAKRAERRAVNAVERSKPVRILPGSSTYSKVAAHEFYKSWAWRTLRMEVLKEYGRTCQCCAAKPGDFTVSGAPVRIVVDHIKPLSKFWNLRLTRSNLQVLCDECNQGKGNWDDTDYRCESVEWTDGDTLSDQYRQIMGGVH